MPAGSAPAGTIPHSLFSMNFGTINGVDMIYDCSPDDISFGEDSGQEILINGRGGGYIDKTAISKPTVSFSIKGIVDSRDLKPMKDLQFDQLMRKLYGQTTGFDMTMGEYKIFALTIMKVSQTAPQHFAELTHFQQMQVDCVGRYYQV